MLGRARLAMFDDLHELRKSPSRPTTTSCRGDGDEAVRGIVHTGHGERVTRGGPCHARCAEFPSMITRWLPLLLLAAAPLLPGPEAADWRALAGAALVALYVAQRRARLLAG